MPKARSGEEESRVDYLAKKKDPTKASPAKIPKLIESFKYRAVFPTYEQLQADGGWDEAILKNLLATQTQRKVSSESATTTTTNGSSTARASSDAMASTVVNGSAVVPPSIHTLLEGTVPLPTSIFHPDRARDSPLKPISHEKNLRRSSAK
ncbi:hypothetical protein IFR04_013749 [Cadophora malorum]|uniref:Uncharacterized protein n=1 Tax=Cadophora malorum TaxID=108018 RepID=A0A8H7T645_9HELO|nr:hypothetical protein IFR04_013749 [Cadophora malorum]